MGSLGGGGGGGGFGGGGGTFKRSMGTPTTMAQRQGGGGFASAGAQGASLGGGGGGGGQQSIGGRTYGGGGGGGQSQRDMAYKGGPQNPYANAADQSSAFDKIDPQKQEYWKQHWESQPGGQAAAESRGKGWFNFMDNPAGTENMTPLYDQYGVYGWQSY